ncbi:MAG: hypothetical protein ACI4PM_00660 [Butyricicoccus sp.]
MNIWENAVITDAGRSLLAKLATGGTMQITAAKSGAGTVTPGLLTRQTAVTDPKQELTLRPISRPESGKISISCKLTNEDLSTGYTAMQIGVYAQDPDDGEILLYIAQAASGTGVTVPSAMEMPGYSADWTFYLQFENADNVTIVVNSSGAVDQAYMEAYVSAELKKLSDQLNEHTSDKNNPHDVTSEQVDGVQTATFAATLMASQWSGTEAPYSQTVSVTGLPAGANGCVGVATSATDEQFTAAADALLRVTAQAAGQVTIKAYGDKPAVNIPIAVSAVWATEEDNE